MYTAKINLCRDYTEGLDEPIRGRKAGVPKQHFFDDLDPEVERIVREAIKVLEGLGEKLSNLICHLRGRDMR